MVRRVSVLMAAAGIATPALAQSAAPLVPGELLYNGADQKLKVLTCRPVAYGRECDFVGWENGRAVSNPATLAEADLIKADARVRVALGQPPRAGTASTAAGSAASRSGNRARIAAGTRVPDGTYHCQLWMGGSYANLGNVRSVGGALSPNPLAKVGATITGVAPSAGGITISYTTARGYRESMDCARR